METICFSRFIALELHAGITGNIEVPSSRFDKLLNCGFSVGKAQFMAFSFRFKLFTPQRPGHRPKALTH